MAAARHPDQLRGGDVHRQLDAEPWRYQPVLLTDEHGHRYPAQGGQRVPLVAQQQRLAEPGDHLDRSGSDHLSEEADDGRADLAVPEPQHSRAQERQIGQAPAAFHQDGAPPLGSAVKHPGQRPAQHRPDRGRHPRAAVLKTAGGGADEHHPGHFGPEQLRVLFGERHDGHAAHGVTDQDHPAIARRGRVDDRLQVGAELVDAGGAGLGAPGPPMVALIPEDEPVTGQITALEVPAVLVQRVAVAEHDGDRGSRRPVDLGVQRHAVPGEHGKRAPAQLPERFARRRVGTATEPPDRDPLGGHDGPRTRRRRASDHPGCAGDPPPAGHRSSRTRLSALLKGGPGRAATLPGSG